MEISNTLAVRYNAQVVVQGLNLWCKWGSGNIAQVLRLDHREVELFSYNHTKLLYICSIDFEHILSCKHFFDWNKYFLKVTLLVLYLKSIKIMKQKCWLYRFHNTLAKHYYDNYSFDTWLINNENQKNRLTALWACFSHLVP